MMESILAAVPAFGVGWLAVARQHALYREAEFRDTRAAGRKAMLLRGSAGLALAIIAVVAFWPDRLDAAEAAFTTAFGAIFVVLAATDLDRRRIPDRLSLPAMALALALTPVWDGHGLIDALAGAGFGLGLGVVFFAVGLLAGPSGGFGLGDVKLMALAGLVLGWPDVMPALFVGILLAGGAAFVLVLRGRGKSSYAYGPYLVAGTLLVLLWPAQFA